MGERFETNDARYPRDEEIQSYIGREIASGDELKLRLARLEGDFYLLQMEVEPRDEVGTHYALGLMQVPALSEARFMECEQKLDPVAWAYGVELETDDNESFLLTGVSLSSGFSRPSPGSAFARLSWSAQATPRFSVAATASAVFLHSYPVGRSCAPDPFYSLAASADSR